MSKSVMAQTLGDLVVKYKMTECDSNKIINVIRLIENVSLLSGEYLDLDRDTDELNKEG